jgi:tetratricopeptide (TPR) repeat protein
LIPAAPQCEKPHARTETHHGLRRFAFVIHAVTTAYRADVGAHGDAFGLHDDQWIAIATLVAQAGLMPPSERQELLARAVDLSQPLLGTALSRQSTDFEWDPSRPLAADSILVVSDHIFQSGALHLARATIDALLEADPSLTPLQRGRALAKRARIDGRLGRIEEAGDQYKEVTRLGRRAGIAELRVRAWIGLGALAQLRGNYPQQMRYSRRAARVADREDLPLLSRLAHTGLMVTAGAQHRFEDAFRHARIAYTYSLGNALREGEILGNIGHLLLEAGHVALAERTFISVLRRRLPVRIVLPVLGSLAVTAAHRGDTARVRWVYSELERLQRATVIPPHDLAKALLDTASALSIVGQDPVAERALDAAVLIAQSRGYHEIIVKADDVRRAHGPEFLERRRPTTGALRLTDYLDTADAAELPEHVGVIGAPA